MCACFIVAECGAGRHDAPNFTSSQGQRTICRPFPSLLPPLLPSATIAVTLYHHCHHHIICADTTDATCLHQPVLSPASCANATDATCLHPPGLSPASCTETHKIHTMSTPGAHYVGTMRSPLPCCAHRHHGCCLLSSTRSVISRAPNARDPYK
jgi:hypothetical protein